MITTDKIKKLVEAKIVDGSDFIVDISVKPGNKITILLDNDKGVSISDCVAMSRHVEHSLDRESEDFELNVMSPGLTEPLKTFRQYQKYIEKQVDVVTKENKKLSGKLLSVNAAGILLETKNINQKRGKSEVRKPKTKVLPAKVLGFPANNNTINLTFNQIKETKIVISF